MKWNYKLQNYLHVNNLFNNIFFFYGNAALSISNKIKKLYETNPIFRYCIKAVNHSTKYVKSVFLEHRIEPMAESWVSISSIRSNNPFYHDYYEYYGDHLYHSNEEDIETRKAAYIDTYNIYKSIISSDFKHKDSIVTLKHNEQYIHRICNKNQPLLITLEELDTLSTRFLSIEYTHPNIKTPIILSLDKGHYLNNNEILSPAFVLKLLEYQSTNYVFDMDYKLIIIDYNVNTIELRFDQYILLKDGKYFIMDN